MRLSVNTVLAAVATLAACTAGLWRANWLWSTLFFTATAFILMFGMMAAAAHHGLTRAFWIGFAVFGLGYFALAVFVERYFERRTDSDIWNEPFLATTWFPAWTNGLISPVDDESLGPVHESDVVQLGGYFTFVSSRIDRFLCIGRSIFALLFAGLGGWLGRSVYRCELADSSTEASACE